MKVCKNNITDILRDAFDANPLKVPESRIIPLIVLEVVNKKPKYLGNMKYLVENSGSIDIPIQSGVVSELSGITSKSTTLKMGFKILSGFLKALGADPAVVGLAIQGNKTLSFSFENVTRKYIDILQFGQVLDTNNITGNPNNFGIQVQGKTPKLALVTSVLQSDNFAISVEKDKGVQGKINVPLIQDYISNSELNIYISKKSENTIQFSGSRHLTFAFSAIDLLFDPESNKFKRGDWLSLKSSPNNTDDKMRMLDFDSFLAEPELFEL